MKRIAEATPKCLVKIPCDVNIYIVWKDADVAIVDKKTGLNRRKQKRKVESRGVGGVEK